MSAFLHLKKYAGDIRFWILLFFFVRLYGIWFPPLEVSHNWRQTTVTMVARNFLETDANILYPRIDIAGELTGITGMEFPLLNYLCYLLSLILGYQHWYGRIIVLMVSSLGIFSFYRLAERIAGQNVAFNASIVLLFSIWYTYSRKIMPDTFSISLMLFSLRRALEFRDKGKPRDLMLYGLYFLLGILSKLPSAYIIGLLAIPLADKTCSWNTRIRLCLAGMPALAATAFWYFYWVPRINQTYGFVHFFMGKGMAEGAAELWSHMGETTSRFYDTAIKYIGFACFTFGMYAAFRQRKKLLLAIFWTGFLLFLPIMLKGGFTFYHHAYYIVPFVPVMALISGYGIAQIRNPRYATIVLIAIGTEGFFNHLDDFFMKEQNLAVIKLEPVLDSLGSRSSLIAINSGEFPTPMYFAHRRGWVTHREQLQNRAYTDSLTQLGLRYIVVMKRTFGSDFQLNYTELYNSKDFRIYDTRNPADSSIMP